MVKLAEFAPPKLYYFFLAKVYSIGNYKDKCF